MVRRRLLKNVRLLLLLCGSINCTPFSPPEQLVAQTRTGQPGNDDAGLVPAVVGLSAAEAKAAVTKAGLLARFQLGQKAPSKQQGLSVAAQDPPQGAKLAKGEVVHLTIFAGDATSPATTETTGSDRDRVVPYLLGGNASDARKALQAHGLVPRFRLGMPAPTQDQSLTVFAQTPQPGTKVDRGSAVAVTIHAEYKPRRPSGASEMDAELTRVVPNPFDDEGIEQIDPRSGQLAVAVTDLSVAAGPIKLEVTRYLQTIRNERGLLGSRWRLNWEKRVHRNASIAVIEEDAGMTPFELDMSGVYRSLDGEQLRFLEGRAIRTLRDGTHETFGPDGRLIQRDLHNGNQVTLRYGQHGALSRVDGPFQTFLEFEVAPGGLLTRVNASNGASVTYSCGSQPVPADDESKALMLGYAYGADGSLVRIERPRTGAMEFSYDERGRVTSRQWADGSRERFEYDGANNKVTHIDPGGNVTTMKWSADRLHAEVTGALGHTTVIDYDQEARPTRMIGPTGEVLTTAYDPFGRIAWVENSVTGRTSFEYKRSDGRPDAIHRPDGERETFEYDGQQNVVRVVRSNARDQLLQTDFEYFANGLVKSIKTSLGLEFFYDYDNDGHLSGITDVAGHVTQFEYDRRGRLLRRIDPLGGVTSYTYDEQGRLIRSIDPTGATTRLQYSPRGLLTRQFDPGGAVTEYQYDERGRVVAKTGPMGRTTRYSYDSAGSIKGITNAAGHTFGFERDAAGNLVRMTNPLGGTTTRDFDPLGRLISQTDPSGGRSRFEYSKAGRLARRTDAAGRTFELSYDASGRMTAATDAGGRTARLAYNPHGELAEFMPPAGPARTYEYDSAGNILRVIESGREVVRYEYNILGQQTKATWATGRVVDYRYDAIGNLVSWNDNLGSGSNSQFDGNSRVTGIESGSGAAIRFRYDPVGNLIGISDPLGGQKRMTHNAAGELTEVVEPSGARATFDYDAAGNLATVRHPGGDESKYSYNGIGAVIATTDPLGNKTRSTYDDAGRLLSKTDAKGQTTTFAYDVADRLVKKTRADGMVVSYTYDDRGNLTEVNDGTFPVRYEYDADRRVTRIAYPAINKTLNYEYDGQGKLARFVDPAGRLSTYHYDPVGRLEAIRLADGYTVTFTYDARNRRTAVSYPNGVKGTWEYDPEDRPTRLTYADAAGKTLIGWNYGYDAAGNCIRTAADGGTIREFRYDADGQLIEEQAPDAMRSYTYNPGGNRVSLKTAQGTVACTYDEGDRLLRAGDETFKYDGNGNLIERSGPKGVTHYDYDAEDRLISVVLPDGKAIEYGYAATGARISRKDSAGLTHYVTDGLHVLAELDDALKTQAAYVYGPGIDNPLMLVRGAEAYCFHADRIGSISRITNSSGEVAASCDYDAFGRITGTAGKLKNDLAFTARHFDTATGLYYYRARYYDPALGRFLGVDPVAGRTIRPLTFNPYQYAMNNPLRFVDPLGLFADLPANAMAPTEDTIEMIFTRTAAGRAQEAEMMSNRLGEVSRILTGDPSKLPPPRIRAGAGSLPPDVIPPSPAWTSTRGGTWGETAIEGPQMFEPDYFDPIGSRLAELNRVASGDWSKIPPRPPSGGGRPVAAEGGAVPGRPAAGAGGRAASQIVRVISIAATVSLVTNVAADVLEGKGPGDIVSDLAAGIANLPGDITKEASRGTEIVREIPLVGDVPAVPELAGGAWAGIKILVVDTIHGAATGIGRLGNAAIVQVLTPLAAAHSTRVAAELDDPLRVSYFPPRDRDDMESAIVPDTDTADEDSDLRDRAEEALADFRDNQRVRGVATQIAADRQRQRDAIAAQQQAAAQQAAIAAQQQAAIAAQQQAEAQAQQNIRDIQAIINAFGNRGGWGGGGGGSPGRPGHTHDQWGRDRRR